MRTSTGLSSLPPTRRMRAGLHEAEELRLQREVHLGDLVEEQRAAVGEFGRARPGSRPRR